MKIGDRETIQWNPSCEATTFASEKWPFKRGGLSSGVEIYTFMYRFTSSSGLSRGGGLSSGWPLKRGSTVLAIDPRSFKCYVPIDSWTHYPAFETVKVHCQTHTHIHACQAGRQFVPFLSLSLVWPSHGANPRSTA